MYGRKFKDEVGRSGGKGRWGGPSRAQTNCVWDEEEGGDSVKAKKKTSREDEKCEKAMRAATKAKAENDGGEEGHGTGAGGRGGEGGV